MRTSAVRPLATSLPVIHQTTTSLVIARPRTKPALSFSAVHSSAFIRPFCTRTRDFQNNRFTRPKHPALHWHLESGGNQHTQHTSQAGASGKHPALHWAVPATRGAINPSTPEKTTGAEPETAAKQTKQTTPTTSRAAAETPHLVAPDGNRRFWRIGDPHCGSVFMQKADDKPVIINVTGFGECFWHPDSRHILQNQVQQGGTVHVVQYDTDIPASSGCDITPWPGSTARIVQSTSNGDWLTPIRIIANKRNPALFDFYTTQGPDVHNDGSVVQWLTKEDGRLGGRVRSVNGEYLFEVTEEKSNSMYGNPEIHFSEVYRWTEGAIGRNGEQGDAAIKWTWRGFNALGDAGGKHLHVNDHPIHRNTLPGNRPASESASTSEK